MQIVIDIPDDQIKKSLEESKYIHEDEGEKGFVNISLLYTNAQLEFVAVERKTDFYDCEYKIIPKGHGRLIDADALEGHRQIQIVPCGNGKYVEVMTYYQNDLDGTPTIIEADRAERSGEG